MNKALHKEVTFLSSFGPGWLSGMVIHLAQVAMALRRSGTKVHWITSRHDNSLLERDDYIGLDIRRIPVLFRMDRGVFIGHRLPLILFAHRKKRLVVALPFPEAGLVAVLGFIFRVKIDVIYICTPSVPDRGLLKKFVLWFVKLGQHLLLNQCEKIGVSSIDYANAQPELRGFREKIFSCPPIIELDRFQASQFKSSNDVLRVGFVGRPTFEKGINNLLKAVEDALVNKVSIELCIVGPKIENESDPTFSLIRNFQKSYPTVLKLLGKISDDELVRFYQNIDVLVLPSVDPLEALGMVQIESMLCGTPVIASALPGVRLPIQRTGFGWLVTPGASDEIATLLKNFKQFSANLSYNRQKIVDDLSSFLSEELSLSFFDQAEVRNSK